MFFQAMVVVAGVVRLHISLKSIATSLRAAPWSADRVQFFPVHPMTSNLSLGALNVAARSQTGGCLKSDSPSRCRSTCRREQLDQLVDEVCHAGSSAYREIAHPAHLAFNGALVSGGFGVWGGQRPDFEPHKSSRRLTGPVASKAFLLAVISTRPLTESLGPAASCAFHSATGLTDHWQESLGPAAFRASRSAFILTRIRMMSIGLATF
ncbi:unnamed protein product [Durusdinium trenchii]|uniref:Uncharacterized protein n=1 Tax=Durusdinium trenchii TaxID=1381693 RepID=A0ABP0N2G3_9DINO